MTITRLCLRAAVLLALVCAGLVLGARTLGALRGNDGGLLVVASSPMGAAVDRQFTLLIDPLYGLVVSVPRSIVQQLAMNETCKPAGCLVMVSDDRSHQDIAIARVGEHRRVAAHPANDLRPLWSPDARWIAFMSWRDGNAEVYLVSADGSGLRRLTLSPDWEDVPLGWLP